MLVSSAISPLPNLNSLLGQLLRARRGRLSAPFSARVVDATGLLLASQVPRAKWAEHRTEVIPVLFHPHELPISVRFGVRILELPTASRLMCALFRAFGSVLLFSSGASLAHKRLRVVRHSSTEWRLHKPERRRPVGLCRAECEEVSSLKGEGRICSPLMTRALSAGSGPRSPKRRKPASVGAKGRRSSSSNRGRRVWHPFSGSHDY